MHNFVQANKIIIYFSFNVEFHKCKVLYCYTEEYRLILLLPTAKSVANQVLYGCSSMQHIKYELAPKTTSLGSTQETMTRFNKYFSYF